MTEPTGRLDHDPARDASNDERELAFLQWREAHLLQIDADYRAWCESGASTFPEDFDAWRSERHQLAAEHAASGRPLKSVVDDAPESEKAQLLFERS